MTNPRIYADFNGLVAGPKDPGRRAIVLDTIGTLRDLSNAGIYLREGMPLVGTDASDEVEDLEGHGTAWYDDVNGRWVLELDAEGIRYVPTVRTITDDRFLCAKCRVDLTIQVSKGLTTGDTCFACGVLIHAPLSPPRRSGRVRQALERLASWETIITFAFLALLLLSGLIYWLIARAG
jgi:hypothetical protein